MAKKGASTDRKKLNAEQDYERSHLAKMVVSIPQVVGAKRAAQSNDRGL